MKTRIKDIKLDIRDKRILFELDLDARKTNSVIANKVGLSKQGVDYRIKNLINNKVILGFYPVIDNLKLGYTYCRLFFKFHNLTKFAEERIVHELKSDNKINWVHKSHGNYDFAIATWLGGKKEFKNLILDLVSKFSPYIKEKKESIGIKVVHYPYRFLLGIKDTKNVFFEETDKKIKLDDLDKRTLKILCENARAPLVQMSNKLKMSPKALAYRIKKLEGNGIILGYRPLINHKLLGYSHYRIMFYLMNVTKEEFERFVGYLERSPQVIFIIDEVGICDIDIEAMFESEKEYFDFMEDLKFKFPTLIKEYETLVGIENLKVNYLPYDL